jgi:TonB-dependent receptor
MKDKTRDNDFFEVSALGDFGETMGAHPLINQTRENFLAGSYTSGSFTRPRYLGNLPLKNPTAFELERDGEADVENFEAEESVSGGFLMIDKNIAPNFSVIAGIRIEHTKVEYEGNQFDTEEETITATTGDDSYTNALPNLHLRYNLGTDMVIRAAWTNTLARPNYYDLVPYRLIENVTELLAEGNSSLKPTTAMNVDLMCEKYFESIGILSIGGFYKTLDDIIFTYQQNNYADPLSGQIMEEYNQPRNGGSASLVGFEAAYQRQLNFLPGIWKGLGVYLNYTFTHSSADEIQGREGEELGLPGNAEHMFNASLSFESSKVVLRLSLNHTSDYLDEVGESSFYDRFYDKQTFLDFNASYAFTSKWRIFLEANNLTNQPLRYYQGTRERVMQDEFYGQRFSMGIKFDVFGTKE